MKAAHILREMQTAFRDANRLFQHGSYEGTVECYNKALRLSSSLPSDIAFDRCRFDASCQAGLSAAFGRLDKPFESFAAANKALLFYDECGEKYPADIGRWLMAMVNQGTALAAFSCFNDAQVAFMRAKEIFISKGLNTPQNKQWIDMVDGNIATLRAHLAKEQ
ncbi:MAG: tetratricopeptide repeat protein [Nitrososphaerota archaeon]|jgi:tetratricopeptide (TPR) repeat protein|nr:tetratricopeptide repeat protein [Nitrososphaerota archaeon]